MRGWIKSLNGTNRLCNLFYRYVRKARVAGNRALLQMAGGTRHFVFDRHRRLKPYAPFFVFIRTACDHDGRNPQGMSNMRKPGIIPDEYVAAMKRRNRFSKG